MTYYFSLRNDNVKDFVSSSGRCIVILTNHTGCNEHFECIFIRKNDTQTIYTIDLGSTDYRNYVTNDGYIYISLKKDRHRFAFVKLHMCDDFDGNIEEPYHYYHFAVNLKDKLKLTGDEHEPIKSIKISDILKNNGSTVEFSLFDEKMMFRLDGTIYYVYSVKIPDKYIGSFLLEKDSFIKIVHPSDNVKEYYGGCSVAISMYRSINGPKGLKDSMGLEIGRPSLKNMWQPEAKPWNWISTKPECNITIDIPKDFIAPYSVADVGAGILEDMRKMSMFESDNRVRIPEIKEVIFNYPATIVCWKDGSKTVVKCGKDEPFDREKAVAMCFLKKMFKPSLNSHWLDVIHDAIQAADNKVAKAETDKAEKARIKAENIAKAEEAKRKKAEKIAAANKIEEIHAEIKSNPPKPLEEMPEEKESPNPGKKNKIDMDTLLACIKEKLTIDEITEMNSWDKAAVARMYYKITGTKPEKKPNTYSELDALFEQGVSVDAAARRTGFSKNIVAMRYAKLQNKNNKE